MLLSPISPFWIVQSFWFYNQWNISFWCFLDKVGQLDYMGNHVCVFFFNCMHRLSNSCLEMMVPLVIIIIIILKPYSGTQCWWKICLQHFKCEKGHIKVDLVLVQFLMCIVLELWRKELSKHVAYTVASLFSVAGRVSHSKWCTFFYFILFHSQLLIVGCDVEMWYRFLALLSLLGILFSSLLHFVWFEYNHTCPSFNRSLWC